MTIRLEDYAAHLSCPQRRAIAYLRAAGLREFVDFGYENAVSVAVAHWAARKRRRRTSCQ